MDLYNNDVPEVEEWWLEIGKSNHTASKPRRKSILDDERNSTDRRKRAFYGTVMD
jgi:hypothetical protein